MFIELIGLPTIGVGFVLAMTYFRWRNRGVAIVKNMAAAMVALGLSLTGAGIGLTVHHRQCEGVLIGFGVTVGVVGLSTGVGIVSFFIRVENPKNIKADDGIPANGSDPLNQPVDEQERSDNTNNETIGDDEGCPQKESGDVPSGLKVEQAAGCANESSKTEGVITLHEMSFDQINAKPADPDTQEIGI